MQQFGTWGDHVTLQAVADTFGVRIAIMTSYQDSCVIEIQPQGETQSQRVLYLSFWAEVCLYGTSLLTLRYFFASCTTHILVDLTLLGSLHWDIHWMWTT